MAGAAQGERLAIALGGRIAATTQAFVDKVHGGGDPRFLALAAPASFDRGENELRLFRIEGRGPRLRLAPFRGSGEISLGADAVKLPNGRSLPLSDALKGALEVVTRRADAVSVTGWSIDQPKRRVPERILLFSGGSLLGSGRPDERRPDLVKAYGPRFRKAGFRFTVASGRPGEIVAVAVSGGRASRLPRLGRVAR